MFTFIDTFLYEGINVYVTRHKSYGQRSLAGSSSQGSKRVRPNLVTKEQQQRREPIQFTCHTDNHGQSMQHELIIK